MSNSKLENHKSLVQKTAKEEQDLYAKPAELQVHEGDIDLENAQLWQNRDNTTDKGDEDDYE